MKTKTYVKRNRKTRDIKSGVSASHVIPEPDTDNFIVQWQNHGSSLTLTKTFPTMESALEFQQSLRPKS